MIRGLLLTIVAVIGFLDLSGQAMAHHGDAVMAFGAEGPAFLAVSGELRQAVVLVQHVREALGCLS